MTYQVCVRYGLFGIHRVELEGVQTKPDVVAVGLEQFGQLFPPNVHTFGMANLKRIKVCFF